MKSKLIEKIRNEVKSGKTKIQVAQGLNLSYYQVKKYTKDFRTELRIPFKLEQKIREEVRNGKSKRQVAEELGVSRDTVIKYTRDIQSHNKERKKSSELIKQIRYNVKKYNSKSKTARIMGISYDTVKWYAKDIPIKKSISTKSKKEKSRRKSINGKSLDLLTELLRNGYALSSSGHRTKEYYSLKKYFPTILKVKMNGNVIFFLEDKKDVATRVFLKNSKKKIMSYQELKQITKVFDISLNKEEKTLHISKSKDPKVNSLHEKNDSLAFFCIRKY